MAKGGYVGIGSPGVAKSIKKAYVGVTTEVPVYEDNTVNITDSNIEEYFTIEDTGTISFSRESTGAFGFTAIIPKRTVGSAVITLIAKKDIKNFALEYMYSIKTSYDTFQLLVNDKSIVEIHDIIDNNSYWIGDLFEGDSLTFNLVRSGSTFFANGETTLTFGNMKFGGIVQTGTEIKQLAKRTKKIYVGDNTNKARLCFPSSINVPSWSTGTDEEIAAAITAAHNGEIDLSDYWKVGDTRKVVLGTMGYDSFENSPMSSQEIELVLVHKLTSNSYYKNKGFIVQQKNCLSSNSYFTFGAEIDGIGQAYNDALGARFSGLIIKNIKIPVGTSVVEISNGIFLPAEKEITGNNQYSSSQEASLLEQWDYYKDSANRIKLRNNTPQSWWLRSYIGQDKCYIHNNTGEVQITAAEGALAGVAPCFII